MRYYLIVFHVYVIKSFPVYLHCFPRSSQLVQSYAGSWDFWHQLCWEWDILEKGSTCLIWHWEWGLAEGMWSKYNFRHFLNFVIFRPPILLWVLVIFLGLRQAQCHQVASHCSTWNQTVATFHFHNVMLTSLALAFHHHLVSSLISCMVLLPFNAGVQGKISTL